MWSFGFSIVCLYSIFFEFFLKVSFFLGRFGVYWGVLEFFFFGV